MYPSAGSYRSREARHRDQVVGALLENPRVVAVRAAMAWKRDVPGDRRTKLIAARLAARKREAGGKDDRLLNERPDRGFSSCK